MSALKFTNPISDFRTIKLDIRLVSAEWNRENTMELPKSDPALEWLSLYWLFQSPNTVWLTNTNVKEKYLHENTTVIRDFTQKCHINISSFSPNKSTHFPIFNVLKSLHLKVWSHDIP